MMRKIKFRVWNKNTNKYEYTELDHYFVIDQRIKAYEYEQYTGLKDKNGKEIYEGDILRINHYSSLYEVVHRRWACSFIGENDEREEICHLLNTLSQDYEVIGNIHENADLIREKGGDNEQR